MGDALTGLGVGVAYGVIAAAIAMASRATRTLHLGIGPAVVLGALVHLTLAAAGALPVAVTLAAGLATGALASALIEPLVLRRVEDEALRVVGTFVVGASIAAVAASFIGAGTVRPTPLLDPGALVVAGTVVPGPAFGAVIIGVPLAAALAWVLSSTRWGAQVRLVGGSPRAAERIGVRPGWVRLSALLVAGALGTVAVLLAAPLTLLGLPQAAGLTLRAVAAALLARDRPVVAMLFGVVMGVAEAVVQSLAPAVGADAAVALVVLAGLLVTGGRHAQSWGRAW
ncbi:MAG: branched-chain amino acid transport system permease protein [Glaciecola sp.]|jgi:branched-chain amino acid transport system permease protein